MVVRRVVRPEWVILGWGVGINAFDGRIVEAILVGGVGRGSASSDLYRVVSVCTGWGKLGVRHGGM